MQMESMDLGAYGFLEFGAHEVFGPSCRWSRRTLVQVNSLDLVQMKSLDLGADEDGKVQIKCRA